MENEYAPNEAHEDGLTPRCGYCGYPLIGMDSRAQYCTRSCKESAREKRKRERERVATYRAKYPDVARAWDEPGHDDDNDQEHQDQDDNGPDTFGHLLSLHEAEQDIRARYERHMKPYLAQQRRNPGVRLPGLVALERERDQEISRMVREYERADELSRATYSEPQRIVRAHERQTERAALQALGNDRYGTRPGRLRQPEFHGRATHDLWDW